MTEAHSKYRLPSDVKPTHYDVTIKTDLINHSFEGIAKIQLQVQKETSKIVFNSHQLDLSQCLVSLSGSKPLLASSVDIAEKEERAIASFSEPLKEGSKAELAVSFKGKLGGSMLGYYQSRYEIDGKEGFYSLTQFEPTAARRCFPCWDEPLLKATFSIGMISRKDTVNLSNMPALSEGPLEDLGELMSGLSLGEGGKDEWKIMKFERTPIMSTYLVALANGPFEHLASSYVSPLSGKERPLRIYATKDLIDQGQYALDIKARVLPVYEKVFDVEFPLPKCDTLIAHDFDSGAMENWGLLTGRPSVYCVDPKTENLAIRKRVAAVMSHEVAHQWFGNIVTMKWWDNLWLNEGFATLMGEMIVLNKIEPTWNLYTDFFDHISQAFSLDGKRSSHPVEVPIEDADEVNQIFDSLSYSKAGSVLRMLSEYVGEDAFVKGVSIYLKKRLYGNSVTRDLWDGISEATGKDINSMMENWILKIGHPVVTVTESDGEIKLRQNRFIASGGVTKEEDETLWKIPLFPLTKDALQREPVLDSREGSLKIDTGGFYKLNGGGRAFFRVLYPESRIAKLAAEAAKAESMLGVEDKLGLIQDAIALAKADLASTTSVLELAYGLKQEKDNHVFRSLNTAVATIRVLLWQNEFVWEQGLKYRRELSVQHVERLGYERRAGDDPGTIQLRSLAISLAARGGDKAVIAKLNEYFNKYLETGDHTVIPGDLMTVVFCINVLSGGVKEWEKMVEIYKKPASAAMKNAAGRALCQSRDPALFERTLEFVKTDVDAGNVLYFFFAFSENKLSFKRVPEWVMSNWDHWLKIYEGNYIQLQYIVNYGFGQLNTEEDAQMVEDFFKDKDTSTYKMALQQELESIRSNAQWRVRVEKQVENWWRKRVEAEGKL